MSANSTGVDCFFLYYLYLPWTVTQATIPLPGSEKLLRCKLGSKTWLKCRTELHEQDEIFRFNLTKLLGGEGEVSVLVFFPVIWVCLFTYLLLWLRESVTCRRLRNSNGCVFKALERTYCIFCSPNTDGERHDGHYFPPNNTKILLSILKLNEANSWFDHKTPPETSNQFHPSASYLPHSHLRHQCFP